MKTLVRKLRYVKKRKNCDRFGKVISEEITKKIGIRVTCVYKDGKYGFAVRSPNDRPDVTIAHDYAYKRFLEAEKNGKRAVFPKQRWIKEWQFKKMIEEIKYIETKALKEPNDEQAKNSH